ncbi:HEPN domain-containing protein [Desulfopila aestuarii]|uniref:HEPN domain-containing protein n=1 Tax=Desulfopila aestuarii DSM 18488 TaxID=1121416 RepID=A0A1M7Y3K6_9BACT|nr:hypothetical protein [Desulfopila aestuarii]SHO46475.1 hypothetical protein SAMN02745220_01519 [Desulfopila aestuarii DSM 18488]
MQLIQIQPKEQIIPIDNWQEYLRDGEQFLRTATRAYETNKRAFSPETLYNLTAMAIEKYIMAFLMQRGDLAENHTMADLAAALERHTGPQPELFANLLLLDSFQDICDFELSRYLPISPQQIPTIIDIGHDVRRFLEPLFHEKEIDS